LIIACIECIRAVEFVIGLTASCSLIDVVVAAIGIAAGNRINWV
jgi:hypothetical protein